MWLGIIRATLAKCNRRLEGTLFVQDDAPFPPTREGQGEGASGKVEAVTTPHPDPFDYAQDSLPPQGGKEENARCEGSSGLRDQLP